LFYRLCKFALLGPMLKLLFGPWVEGIENVPTEGPAILASNHLSFSDSFLMPLKVPRTVYFLAKSEYFTGRGIKGRLTAAFFRNIGCIPIDRTGGRAADPALQTGLRVLREGKLLALYPEGTRSPDGRLYKGRTGIARIALASGVPVIPCAMIGTADIQPPGKVLPKIGKVGVRFGKPLDFTRYQGMENDRFILRSVTDEIMYALMELASAEYVDVYATKAKEEIAARRERGTTSGHDNTLSADESRQLGTGTGTGTGSASGEPAAPNA
jgi:1-acyl-sn-glycerol-3-phosphate acyltransferase